MQCKNFNFQGLSCSSCTRWSQGNLLVPFTIELVLQYLRYKCYRYVTCNPLSRYVWYSSPWTIEKKWDVHDPPNEMCFQVHRGLWEPSTSSFYSLERLLINNCKHGRVKFWVFTPSCCKATSSMPFRFSNIFGLEFMECKTFSENKSRLYRWIFWSFYKKTHTSKHTFLISFFSVFRYVKQLIWRVRKSLTDWLKHP